MALSSLLLGLKLKFYGLLQPFFGLHRIPRHWKGPGRFLGYELMADNLELILHCEQVNITISLAGKCVFRVLVQRRNDPVYNSISVLQHGNVPLAVAEEKNGMLMITGSDHPEAKLFFSRDNCTCTFMHGTDELFRETTAAGACRGWVHTAFRSQVKEKYAGLGQKTGRIFKNSGKFVMWNTDDSNIIPDSDPLYQSCPLLIALRTDGTAHGIFFDNPHYSVFMPGDYSSTPVSSYTAERGPLCYYVLPGRSLKEVVCQYTELTGKYLLPPRWVLGHHHSRWEELESTDKIMKLAEDFRKHAVPCDVIHIDIGHMNGYRCFTWHPGRFPDPAALVKNLHSLGFKVVVISDPGLKKDRHWAVYREGTEEDVFCKDKHGRIYHGPVWPGKCAFVDYLSDKAARWWGNLYRTYTEIGIDGFWNDMNEPAIFTPRRTMPDKVVFRGDNGERYDHKTMHNIYGMLMAGASAMGITSLRPGMRYFLFCRASFAGIQRYASTWTGDNSSNWEHLRMSVPMLLNMGLCGQVMCGPDTGGFWKTPTEELMIRWVQLSAFYPFCRNHTSLSTPPQEFWNMGETVKAMARQYLGLRYRLLPYLYTCLHSSCVSGLPMMRPLFLDFPGDPAVLEEDTADTTFMAGEHLLVAPVLHPGQTEQRVYLPAGTDWVDWWSREKRAGGNHYLCSTPPDRIPFFVKSGSVLPMSCGAQTTNEIDACPLQLVIYPDREINGTVYLDDGATTEWQVEEYSLLKISGELLQDSLTVKIERTAGNPAFPHYHKHPALVLKIYLEERVPQTVTAGGKPLDRNFWSIAEHWLEIQAGRPQLPWVLKAAF